MALLEAHGYSISALLTELPEWAREAISAELVETFEQGYWDDIHDTFQGDAERYLKQGLAEGRSIRWMATNMAERLGGGARSYARRRAERIARTESGHALNGARKIGMESITGDPKIGQSVRPVWLSVLGNTTRDAHADLDGVPADKDGTWLLAGRRIPWPAHISLPPSQRVNCQCTMTLEFGLSDQEADERLQAYYQRGGG
jgi:hypothetical protein